MSMNSDTYKSIISTITNYEGLSIKCFKLLQDRFPEINSDTLYSILSLHYQKRMKVNHMKTVAVKNEYWKNYKRALKNCESPGIILRMSVHYQVTPCLIAKLILQKYLDDLDSIEDKESGSAIHVNDFLRDTSLILDMDLAYEVFLCTLYDNLYSPLSETMKHSLGQQYEVKLHKEVVKLGLAFRNEEHLRITGYDKTPDVKLEVPIAIDGMVINWIESKALFGDEEAHKEYIKNQYLSYWNRFGPGLVIYWFGYLHTIVEKNDKRFLIRDYLPTNIVQMSIPS